MNTLDSYAFNQNLYGGGKTGANASLSSPASTVLLCEIQGEYTDIANGDQEEGNVPSVNYNFASASVDGLDVDIYGAAPVDLINYNSGSFNNFSGSIPGSRATKYATGEMGGVGPTNGLTYFTGILGIHNGGSNFLLADGHVKWLRGSSVSPGHNGLPGQYQGQTANDAAATNDMFQGNGTTPVVATFSPT